MRRRVQVFALTLCVGGSLASGQVRPAHWTATEIALPKCGDSDAAFEFVTEWRDGRGQVRELAFSRPSLMDAYNDLSLNYDASGKLHGVRWNVTGDWDYAQLAWQLGPQENVISVRETGRQDGLPYTRPLPPSRYPVPDAYRLRPTLTTYQRLACTDVVWPTR